MSLLRTLWHRRPAIVHGKGQKEGMAQSDRERKASDMNFRSWADETILYVSQSDGPLN